MKALGVFNIAAAVSFVGRGLAATNSSTNSSTTNAYLASGYLDLGIASSAYEKAKAFVAPLNVTQKIAIVTASDFTSNNASWMAYTNTDGVDGINFYYYVSGFVMGNALTQTWNRDLIAAQFKAVGEEYFGTGHNMVDGALLSPLGRVPEGGRQNEAFSPDPYLSGISVAAGVKGQQEAGVIAGVRHFLLYEQETNRMSGSGGSGGMGGMTGGNSTSNSTTSIDASASSTSVSSTSATSASSSSSSSGVYSSNADDKTLHEVYMWPWGDAIQAGTVAIMCAMPLVNGTHSCENNELLSAKLKEELGFPGLVYPDESAQFSSYDSATAGLDYSPSSDGLWTQATLAAGIANGSLPEERLDDMAIRSVLPYFFVGLDTAELPETGGYTDWRDIRGNHSALIRKIGGEAISLLKNNNANGGGLPLNRPHSLSLYGSHAGPAQAGPNFAWSVAGTGADIYEGHLVSGGGSGDLSLPYVITPFNSLTQRAVQDNSMIFWIMNNTYTSSSSGQTFGIGGGTGVSPSYANYASQSEVCLVFINSWSGEGADRGELSNDDQDNLVLSVAESCNNTVVVINSSGPRLLDAWIENENITAVLYSGLLGQESGNAIADVLYGDVNPSGKLIHTIAKNASDYPASVCETTECSFDEGVYVDYRWFDANDIEPRYPFGHGLSYTSFTYGTVSAAITNSTAISQKYPSGVLTLGGQADLYDEVISVSTIVSNTGALDGAEVAQLYLSSPSEASQPVRTLRGFEKVSIPVGQTANVTFSVRRRDISYWDVAAQSWAIASGEYTFSVGSSSRDLRGNATLTI
ncbi:hypothetical protein SCUP515_13343 [Seiridium cupressi]